MRFGFGLLDLLTLLNLLEVGYLPDDRKVTVRIPSKDHAPADCVMYLNKGGPFGYGTYCEATAKSWRERWGSEIYLPSILQLKEDGLWDQLGA